jgi:hypothetical protein
MANNDFLKKERHNDKFYQDPLRRYVVFVYNYYYPVGGSGDVSFSYDTLSDIEAAYRINSDNKIELDRIVPDYEETPTYQYMEVLDLQERQFIDINQLNFLRVTHD